MDESVLREHVPPGLLATAVLGVAGFFSRRWFVRRDHERKAIALALERHDERLDGVEKDMVTRDDFDELRESMVASHAVMADRLESKLESAITPMRDDIRMLTDHLLGRRR